MNKRQHEEEADRNERGEDGLPKKPKIEKGAPESVTEAIAKQEMVSRNVNFVFGLRILNVKYRPHRKSKNRNRSYSIRNNNIERDSSRSLRRPTHV